MPIVNVSESRTQLSRLLAQVEEGDEVVISHRSHPVARLVPYKPQRKRKFGSIKGYSESPAPSSNHCRPGS